MKLNQIINLRVEDFKSEESWIGRLFVQLNPWFQAANQIFDSNIDYSTNIKSVIRPYTITSSFQAFSFSWPYVDQEPQDVKVLKALKGTQKTPTILLVAWTFDSAKRVIEVTRMVEVTTSAIVSLNGRYDFTLRATV